MNPDDLKKVVLDALKDHHSEFYIPNEQHYLHHKSLEKCMESRDEWEANHTFISEIRLDRSERDDNHKFVSDVRVSGKKVRTTSLLLIVTTAIVWIIKTLFGGN